ncbi:hypothetical protein CL656_02365 [bacterium]|nr:hypothetical protein [bacterium]|tara:strand:+ start:7581 stop:8456 length:876 start_codon:yes stop_codon:yes gene_type:complete
MLNKVTNLVYNQRKSLINPQIQEYISSSDVILVYDSKTTQELIRQYRELSKGVISPSNIESTHSSEFLNYFYKLKKTVIPFNPPIDQISHNPYRKLIRTNLEQEQKICSEFIDNQPYQALTTSSFSINMYNQSFTYLYNYLENYLEEIPYIIQDINQNLAYSRKQILIISNPNLLEFKFMKPNLIDKTIFTESYFNLSIRHEIFRRNVLDLEVPESLIYGYIIECSLKNLSQEKKLNYGRNRKYPYRKTITSLTFEEFTELSKQISQISNTEQITSTTTYFLDTLAKNQEA